MDFKYLNKFIEKFVDNFPSRNCLTIKEDENSFSYTINKVLPKDEYGFGVLMASKIFYSLYIRPYGFENVKKEICNIIDSIERKWAEYFLKQANDIKIVADKDFESDLCEVAEFLNIPYELLDSIFEPYKPFLFLKDYIEFGVANFSNDNYNYFYILILIYIKNQYLWDNGDDEEDDDEYLEIQKEIIDVFIKYKNEKVSFQIDRLFTTFDQINKTSFLDKKFFLSYNKVLYNDGEIPLDGDIFVPWTNVVFWDGYYFIYHPSFPNGDKGRFPLRIEDKSSRRDFNNLQKHFMKKLCPIYVSAVDGRIKKVHNHQDLLECIDIINKKIHPLEGSEQDDEKIESKKKYLSKNETKDIIKQYKLNHYLEYLCNEQLDDYKVIYCVENRINSNENMTIEHSFIFTIKDSSGNLKLIFENTEISRCTYAFITSKESWDKDVESISDFFVSDIVNKRLNITRQKHNMPILRNLKYSRITHTDYYKWKQHINIDINIPNG